MLQQCLKDKSRGINLQMTKRSGIDKHYSSQSMTLFPQKGIDIFRHIIYVCAFAHQYYGRAEEKFNIHNHSTNKYLESYQIYPEHVNSEALFNEEEKTLLVEKITQQSFKAKLFKQSISRFGEEVGPKIIGITKDEYINMTTIPREREQSMSNKEKTANHCLKQPMKITDKHKNIPTAQGNSMNFRIYA